MTEKKKSGSRQSPEPAAKQRSAQTGTVKQADKMPASKKKAEVKDTGSNTAGDTASGTVATDPAEDVGMDWGEALAEQGAAEPAVAEDVRAGASIFQELARSGNTSTMGARELAVVMDIPVKLNVILGRTRLTIKELLELSEGSVVELDGLAGDPLDILINDYLVAQGEVVVVDDKYGIRITEIVTPSERIHKLNR